MNSRAENNKVDGLFSCLRKYLLTGILVTAPISLTVYLIYLVIVTVDWIVSAALPEPWHDYFYGQTVIPGIGLLIAAAFFIFVGWLSSNFLGRWFIDLTERGLNRMPLIRLLYGTLKQVFEAVAMNPSKVFSECVLVEYPNKNSLSIGFITGKAAGKTQVFLPMAFNPTSGIFILASESEIKPSGMNVEEGLKMVISAGILKAPGNTKGNGR